MKLAFAATAVVYFASNALAVPSLLRRADPAAGLVTNTTAYAEYCFAKNPDYKDRRACFEIDGDIRKRMVSSYDIRGFTTEDGSFFVVLPDQARNEGRWMFKTDVDDVLMLEKYQTSCVQVSILHREDPPGDESHAQNFEQCSGGQSIRLRPSKRT